MTERDELRRRVGAILETEYPREWVAEDVTGQQYSEWYREKADVVLAEIERTHVLVPRVDERLRRSVGDAAQYLVNPKGRRIPF